MVMTLSNGSPRNLGAMEMLDWLGTLGWQLLSGKSLLVVSAWLFSALVASC